MPPTGSGYKRAAPSFRAPLHRRRTRGPRRALRCRPVGRVVYRRRQRRGARPAPGQRRSRRHVAQPACLRPAGRARRDRSPFVPGAGSILVLARQGRRLSSGPGERGHTPATRTAPDGLALHDELDRELLRRQRRPRHLPRVLLRGPTQRCCSPHRDSQSGCQRGRARIDHRRGGRRRVCDRPVERGWSRRQGVQGRQFRRQPRDEYLESLRRHGRRDSRDRYLRCHEAV